MKRSFYYKDNPMVPFFVLFSGLLFLCVFVLPILITLKEQSILPLSKFLLYQKIVFGIVIASFLGIVGAFILAVLCSLIFKIIKLPETEETYLNQKRKLLFYLGNFRFFHLLYAQILFLFRCLKIVYRFQHLDNIHRILQDI